MISPLEHMVVVCSILWAFTTYRFVLIAVPFDASNDRFATLRNISATWLAILYDVLATLLEKALGALIRYFGPPLAWLLRLLRSSLNYLKSGLVWIFKRVKGCFAAVFQLGRKLPKIFQGKHSVKKSHEIQSNYPYEIRPPTLDNLEPFRPPDTWDAHRSIRLGFCRCSPSVLRMDPLMAAAAHNLTCSPLCSLAEELLLEIMTYVSLCPISMQCLRHTSRVFLRIYCSSTFAGTHDNERPKLLRFQNHFWRRPSAEYFPRHLETNIFASQLQRDLEGYCGDCRAARVASTWAKRNHELLGRCLHCSGCNTTHPRVLFSRNQRDRVPKNDRICIGREGHIRLCEHKVIKWRGISSVAKILSSIHWKCAPTAQVLRCSHESHLPVHHGSKIFGIEEAVQPSAILEGRSRNRMTLVLSWQGHMLVEPPCPRGTSPNHLRRQIHRLRKGVAEYIAPEMSPGRLPEMTCFDPNSCSCLHFDGQEKLRGWKMPCAEDLILPSCRVYKQYRIRSLQHEQRGCDHSNKQSEEDEEWVGGHYSLIQTTGVENRGTSNLHIDANPCPADHPRCMTICYKRVIDLSKATDNWIGWIDQVPASWYQALDPDSFDLTSDLESFGVTWCRQPGCKNYYQYLRKAVVQAGKTN